MPGRKNFDFSFSGLKTSAAVRIKREGIPAGDALRDFTASFQEAVVDTLVRKTLLAARAERLEDVLAAGGVAANARLREKMQARAAEEGMRAAFPSASLCTDNAAMVAALAASYLAAGRDDGLTLDADAGLGWHAG
jgi:N6-L-threonylcarbamoyladenine synthase